MGWSLGYDSTWDRDIGYGVPAKCDHPGCNEYIDRGLGYVCCDQNPYGGERGCGLFFCSEHSDGRGRCERCNAGADPFTPTPDVREWIEWKLTHDSWREWRDENPEEVAKLREALKTAAPIGAGAT